MNELEERAAALLGQEEAVFLPTATMANQIALRLHTAPGDELVAEENCHVLISELGGPGGALRPRHARAAGGRRPLHARAGARRRTARRPSTAADARRLRSRTRTTRPAAASGRSTRSTRCRAPATSSTCAVHLDGARLLNAAVASGVAAATIGAPLRHRHALPLEGARLPARRAARRLGRDDARARRLQAPLRRRDAAGGDRRGGRRLRARPQRRAARRRPRPRQAARRGARRRRGSPSISTRRDELRPDRRRRRSARRREAIARARRARASGCRRRSIRPCSARVTHLDVTDEDIERALEAIPRALGARACASRSGRRPGRRRSRRRRRRRSGSRPCSRLDRPLGEERRWRQTTETAERGDLDLAERERERLDRPGRAAPPRGSGRPRPARSRRARSRRRA